MRMNRKKKRKPKRKLALPDDGETWKSETPDYSCLTAKWRAMGRLRIGNRRRRLSGVIVAERSSQRPPYQKAHLRLCG